MVSDCFVSNRIELACLGISIELFVPVLGIKLEKPSAKTRQLLGRKMRHGLFEFFKSHDVIIPKWLLLRREKEQRMRQCVQNLSPLGFEIVAMRCSDGGITTAVTGHERKTLISVDA